MLPVILFYTETLKHLSKFFDQERLEQTANDAFEIGLE